jgi:signal transduction histidine kinase
MSDTIGIVSAKLRTSRWREGLLVVLGMLLLGGAHWLVPRADKQYHNIVFHLDFIPIVVAGMLFGWRGGALAGLGAGVLQLPLLWVVWWNDRVYLMDQFGEITVDALAGIVVGFMADRERRQRLSLEATKRELERVYTELQQNFEQLKKADRMYAVAQLSAGLAHEIRNPLAGISGAAGILKRGQANPQNTQECIDIIHRESQRLKTLLTNFLDFARPRTPRFQPTELEAVIDSVIALAGHSPGASAITFHRRIESPLPEVECDSEQVKQVLLNLLINAIQATREGVVELRAFAQDDAAFVSVCDQGGGIPPDKQDHIFEPFFTTKESGTGLGLAVAAKIMEQHGGALIAENRPGQGLTMTLQLPLERSRVQ